MSHDIAFKTHPGVRGLPETPDPQLPGRGPGVPAVPQVNFDPLSYLEMVKRYNGYKETPPSKTAKTGKMSYRIKSDKIKTFDDDDEEDEEGVGGRGTRDQVVERAARRYRVEAGCHSFPSCTWERPMAQAVLRPRQAWHQSRSQAQLGNPGIVQIPAGEELCWGKKSWPAFSRR